MKERNKAMKNKKQKFIANKTSKLNSYFTSILKLSLAIALFFIAAFMISGAGIIVEDGALNVSNNLLIDTNTLFVDSANNKVGIGTASPGVKLHILGTSEQLRLSYDASNYASFTVASDGALTLQTTGTDEDIEIRTGSFDNAIFIDDSSSRIGFGTASPNEAFTFNGLLRTEVTGAVHLRLADGTGTIGVSELWGATLVICRLMTGVTHRDWSLMEQMAT